MRQCEVAETRWVNAGRQVATVRRLVFSPRQGLDGYTFNRNARQTMTQRMEHTAMVDLIAKGAQTMRRVMMGVLAIPIFASAAWAQEGSEAAPAAASNGTTGLAFVIWGIAFIGSLVALGFAIKFYSRVPTRTYGSSMSWWRFSSP